jgi:alkylation response protein AidB-like acyl-CoA dehydrogenase
MLPSNLQLFFRDLRSCAADNLSTAHILQHTTASQSVIDHLGISVAGPGSYSVQKPKDTITFDGTVVNGTKQWVSGLNQCAWAVVTAKHNQEHVMVLVTFDDKSKVVDVPTVGMERTYTKHIEFNNSPATYLYSRSKDVEFFIIDQFINLGFITNHLGLADGILADLESWLATSQQECSYQIKQLKLNIKILELVWQSLVEDLENKLPADNTYWNKATTVYAFAKKTLLDLTKLVVELTGSGLYETHNASHQRFKDALIYCSHMRNLYKSVENL